MGLKISFRLKDLWISDSNSWRTDSFDAESFSVSESVRTFYMFKYVFINKCRIPLGLCHIPIYSDSNSPMKLYQFWEYQRDVPTGYVISHALSDGTIFDVKFDVLWITFTITRVPDSQFLSFSVILDGFRVEMTLVDIEKIPYLQSAPKLYPSMYIWNCFFDFHFRSNFSLWSSSGI